MNLTRISVGRPIGTGIAFLTVMLLGVVALRELPVDLLPDVDFPRISIVTSYEGVGPEEIETLITRPIEQTVATINGIDRVEAVSAEGLSRVQLQFAWGTDLETAVNDVRAYLDRLAARLPEEAERPVVHKFDLSAVPIASLAVSGSGDPRRLRYLADDTLTRRLEGVPGIAAVQVQGGRVREIRIELQAARLTSLGVSALEVSQALSRDNRNISAGDMRQTNREVLVRTVGEWQSTDEIAGTLVAIRDGRPVYVRDVGEVLDTYQKIRSERWLDGQAGITLRISKQSGANTVEAVAGLREEIAAINREYQGVLQVRMLQNASDYIEAAITNVLEGGLYGALLSILTLLFFLRDVRGTVVITLAIPLCVISTFALMYFTGYSLNAISFGGLALGIGMVVDNATVILENIYRKRDLGLSPTQASLEGTREVGPPIISGTMTTVVVFVPVLFMGGFASIFFREMAMVVTFSMLASLVVALTLVPSLTALLLQFRPRRTIFAGLSQRIEGWLDAMENSYARLLERSLKMPWFVVMCSVLLLVFSIRLSSLVGFELMPETDEGRINIDIEMPVGTPVEQTGAVVREMEERARKVLKPDETISILSSAGPPNAWQPGAGHEGELEIYLVPVADRARGIDAIMGDLRDAFVGIPDASIRMRKASSNFLLRLMRGSTGERLVVDIRGHDLETAQALAARVQRVMKEVEGITDIRIDREEGLEERTIEVDTARAADLGLTRANIAETVETYVLGRVATRLRSKGDEFDVRVQLTEADRKDLEQLSSLPIITPDGHAVPLASVAHISGRRGPSSISRIDQERVLKVLGGLGDRSLSKTVADLERRLQQIEMPQGFTLRIGGESEQQEQAFSGLKIGLWLAMLLVYAVMAMQFESLRHPLVIMAAVPFAFIGIVLTLVVTGTTFNLNSFLGTICLVGIVVNNAIVLIDYTNLLRREQKMELLPAVVDAGRKRLRPILMTTLTTILGVLPLALSIGEGGELQAPLARVILGGLTSSTVITLVIVPCLYVLWERRRAARSSI